MDCSAIVLNKLLLGRDIDIWAKLKLSFLDPAYSSIYSAISRYYDKYNTVPSFDELELTLREGVSQKTLASLRLIDEPDISPEVALDALIDQYTQNQAIEELEKFIDKLPVYDTDEIKDNLNGIVLRLDEKTLTTEGVYTMADVLLFKNNEDLSKDRVYLGLNNTFDAALSGVCRQELILVGGPRGSGKSITASNVLTNQYEIGNCGVLFTIEMLAQEVVERNLAILANVPYVNIKTGMLSDEEVLRVVKTRAGMFTDAHDLIEEFRRHKNRFKFESDLVRNKSLKPDNQMIIVDDRALTLTAIDLHLGKLKARFGDKLTVGIVDYLNQVVLEGDHGHNSALAQFDWKPQVVVSKKLKELARKHDIVIYSPYQIDSSGEARFAKGILDAADIALVMDVHDKEKGAITFKTTKIRSGPEMQFTSGINWDTLRIHPHDVEMPTKEKAIKKVTNKKDDSKSDIPWDV